jgi:hypothetical protein
MDPYLHKNYYFINQSKKIKHLLYADDQVVVTDSEDNLQRGIFML